MSDEDLQLRRIWTRRPWRSWQIQTDRVDLDLPVLGTIKALIYTVWWFFFLSKGQEPSISINRNEKVSTSLQKAVILMPEYFNQLKNPIKKPQKHCLLEPISKKDIKLIVWPSTDLLLHNRSPGGLPRSLSFYCYTLLALQLTGCLAEVSPFAIKKKMNTKALAAT